MSADPAIDSGGVVLIPVKAFAEAKVRLSATLEPSARAGLARRMATHVVRAQQGLAVAICCDDVEVADWADSLGARTIWCPEPGLNAAVQHGVAELCSLGYPQIAVAHGDLPLAHGVSRLFGWPGVTIVPDRHRTGTNVLVLPASIDFRFGYGIGSFARHVTEAVRHRRGLRIVHDAELGWDIDDPGDLELPDADVTAAMLATELTGEGAP